MARRKSNFGNVKSLIRKAGAGLLGAMVVGAVAQRFAPKYQGIAGIAGAYMNGGAVGALSAVVLGGTAGTQTNSQVVLI